MAGKNMAVFGIYPSRGSAEDAVDALRIAGFRSTDVSVLFSENQGTKDFAHEKATKSPEGTAAAVKAALDGGARGVILSRKYSEMRLDNLFAVKEAIP